MKITVAVMTLLAAGAARAQENGNPHPSFQPVVIMQSQGKGYRLGGGAMARLPVFVPKRDELDGADTAGNFAIDIGANWIRPGMGEFAPIDRTVEDRIERVRRLGYLTEANAKGMFEGSSLDKRVPLGVNVVEFAGVNYQSPAIKDKVRLEVGTRVAYASDDGRFSYVSCPCGKLVEGGARTRGWARIDRVALKAGYLLVEGTRISGGGSRLDGRMGLRVGIVLKPH